MAIIPGLILISGSAETRPTHPIEVDLFVHPWKSNKIHKYRGLMANVPETAQRHGSYTHTDTHMLVIVSHITAVSML